MFNSPYTPKYPLYYRVPFYTKDHCVPPPPPPESTSSPRPLESTEGTQHETRSSRTAQWEVRDQRGFRPDSEARRRTVSKDSKRGSVDKRHSFLSEGPSSLFLKHKSRPSWVKSGAGSTDIDWEVLPEPSFGPTLRVASRPSVHQETE